MAHFGQLVIETGDDFGHRQWGTIARRFFTADPQILAHPVNSKTEIELVPDHRVATVDHLPGLRRAA